MWNNFSSSFANVSSSGPVRSSSTVFPHRSDQSTSLLRESPSRSSLRESSYSRNTSIRDSFSSPQVHRRSDIISSRVTRDSETSGLLERYGSRRGSATETPTQAFLKQRKQSEPDGGLFMRGTACEVPSREAGSFGYGTYANNRGYQADATGSSWAQATPAGQMQTISQQDYMNRLLAAHNRVDELLRSRGLNSEDEGKYLRAWEQIPIIHEERFRRLRSPSNSSDSGLSTDNDSDRSNAEPAVPEETVEVKKEFEQMEDDVCTFSIILLKPRVKETVSYTVKLQPVTVQSQSIAVEFAQREQCQSCSAISPLPRVISNQAQLKQPTLSRSAVPVPQPEIKEKIKNSPPAEVNVSRNLGLIKKTCQFVCDRVWKDRRIQKTAARFEASVSNDIEKHFTIRRKPVNSGTEEQRRKVLSSIKRKKAAPIPSTAEISIQHCSFFQVMQSAVAALPEKNVRINLRLTERAPKNCATSITLPAPPRVAYVRLDILAELPPIRRTMSTQIVSQQKKRVVGKLERGFTVDLAEVPREQRKVNRLKIPEYFLQQSAEALEDINGVRNNLKKAPANTIIGGFVYELKPQPQTGLRRAGAIRRRPPPQKPQPIIEPFADFLPNEPPDPPDPPPENLCHQNETGHLNLPGSLDRPATSSRALTRNESFIAELSETDRQLVEQFRRSLNIPCPQTIIRRALSPFTLRCFQQETAEKRSPSVSWIHRKNPKQLDKPPKERCPSPPCLKRVYRNTKKVTKYIFGEWTVTLRRVDRHAPLRPKPKRRRLPKWIPRWRRKHRSEEEVEEVEEEEVVEEEVEEVEKSVAPSDEPRHERVISKSYNDEEEEGLTEGEKAMAAAKRRHEEEQQAKLLDYEEKRRIEREKEEDELRRLKEKQEKRRQEREQEEREMLERRQQEEERRRREEEERKQRIENEKRKKEEANRKKNQISGGAFTSLVNTGGSGGRNFTIPKKSDTMGDKFGNIVQAKQEMGMTKDQQEQAKKAFLTQIAKGIAEASGVPAADLKNKIKELHQRICKLEADKYDLEKRHERQEYDLKELNERQRQVARNNAVKKGLDPTEAGNSRHPPKVQMLSKYDRQIDRRNFAERRAMYENRNAHPCFPGVPPPAVILEKVILKYDTEEKNEDEPELNKPDKALEIAKGSAKPPPDWGRKIVPEDIEAYLRNPERCPKYVEKKEADKTETRRSPPMEVKPLIIPKIFAN